MQRGKTDKIKTTKSLKDLQNFQKYEKNFVYMY